MNKYQKALNRLCIAPMRFGEDLYDGYKEEIDLLQELVDKETPKKVKLKLQNDYVECHYVCSYELAFCPKCGLKNDFNNNYCPNCGQKLDWSDDNE